jgi:hypothetical protein
MRSKFRENPLIYVESNDCWVQSTSCVWHSTAEIENYTAIAAEYPKLKEFFVDVLGINTVTDVFLMKELAAAASRQSKDVENIKRLMLAASQKLDGRSPPDRYGNSLEILEANKFLPCTLPNGGMVFCTTEDAFFIVDNQSYGIKFQRKLLLLDFSYEQLNSLHELFCILRIDDRYLQRHVDLETVSETSSIHDGMTKDIRQCAYPISWFVLV